MALPETELIHQYHNRQLLKFISILNGMKKNESISFRELEKQIQQISGYDFGHFDAFLKYLEEHNYENDLFSIVKKSDKKFIKKLSDSNLILPMSQPEKIYLKNALKSPYAVLFLDNSIIQRLSEGLFDTPDIRFSEIIDTVGISAEPEFDEAYIQNFRILMQAIREKRKINFLNIDKNGNTYPNYRRIPVKIEYSVIMRGFWVSMWNQKEQRPFKANISRISDIELLDEISESEYQTVQRMLEQKKEETPIVMTVTSRNNAIERISLLFSMYQKTTEQIDKNTVKISLRYYQFDEDEIVDNIMSFGTAVHVLSPERVVDKIKERLLSTGNFI